MNDNNNNMNDNEVNLELLFGCYKAFLEKIDKDSDFSSGSNSRKIRMLLEIISGSVENVELGMGACIFLFEIVFRFKVEKESTDLILESIYGEMERFVESGNYHIVLCMLEIIIVIGHHEVSLDNINKLIALIMDENITVIQH